jgi:Ca2+-transporting ATPase
MLWRVGLLVPMAAAATFGWFAWRQNGGVPYDIVRTETFTVLAACQWFNVLNCQSATRSALQLGIFRNRWLLGGLASSILLQGAVLYWAPLGELFHTVPIPPADLLPIMVLASLVLWVEELRKLFVRRSWVRCG